MTDENMAHPGIVILMLDSLFSFNRVYHIALLCITARFDETLECLLGMRCVINVVYQVVNLL